MMDFRSAHAFSVKKADNSANFAAGGIINRRTHHNSRCRNRNKHWMTSYMMVHKAMSHVTLPRMRELSPTPTLLY
jgi:RNase P protein component